MSSITIDIKSPNDDQLLLFGVPFVKGTFSDSNDLKLIFGDRELPTWYTIRNRWQDGTIRWIFLHSRVPAGEYRLSLTIIEREKRETPAPTLIDNSLTIAKCHFSIGEDSFTFTGRNGSVTYSADIIESDIHSELFNPSGWEIGLIEASPIAPLVRISEPSGGFCRDFFVRIDPANERLIVQRRITVSSEGFYFLQRSAGRFIFSEPFPESRTVVLKPGSYRENGGEQVGYPTGLVQGPTAALYVDKFWQRFPAAIEASGGDVCVEYYPDEAKPLPVSGGMSYRHIVRVACGSGCVGLGDDVEVVIDPRQLMDSLACELIYLPEGHFSGYEEINRKILFGSKNDLYSEGTHCADIGEEEKQHPDFFGLEHYGDFPAPLPEYRSNDRPTFYWDNEYDTAFGYYRGYAMYGDPRAIGMGFWHAVHMSDMDISSISGDMKCHGSGHHHTKFASEMGHVWNDACWLNYFFFGDIWAKEAGEKLCHRILSDMCQNRDQLIHGYCFAERYTGWPLMVLIAGYEALRDDKILEGAQFLVDFMIDFFEDPYSFYEKEYYFLGEPSEFYRSALMDGCKPFMLGVIMESMERYFFSTGDERVIEPLKKICDFIIDNMWDFNRGAFMYEWNAYDKAHFEEYNQFLACLFIRGFAFTYSQTGIRKYRDVSTIAFHACIAILETGEGAGGKNFAQLSRSLGGFVAYLDEWRREDDTRYITSCSPAKAESFFWEGSIPDLMDSGEVDLKKGTPEYDGEALVSTVSSFIDGRFLRPVGSDRGEIALYVYPEEHILPHARVPNINFRTCFHVCSDTFNQSGISVLTRYSRELIVKAYDQRARQINVATAWTRPEGSVRDGYYGAQEDLILDWRFEQWQHVKISWQAPGQLLVILDGHEMDRIELNRPLGGELTRLCLGYRPGNWRYYGKVKLDYINLG